MSAEEMTRALAARDLRTLTKFVLVIIADQATGDSCARTSIQHIAAQTGMVPDSVERSLAELVLSGHITVLARQRKKLTVRFNR